MMKIAALLIGLLGALLALPAQAQTFVVTSCPNGTTKGVAGQTGRPFAIDVNGNMCVTGSLSASFTPSSSATAGVAGATVNAAAAGSVLKATPGNLYSLGVKIGATTGYVLLIDATAVPSNGAVTALWCKPVLSNGTLGGDDWTFNPPLVFATGITALFSTNTDCTSFTGSATAQFSGQPK